MKKDTEIIVIPNEDSRLEYKERVDSRGLARQIVVLSNSKRVKVKIWISDNKEH